MTSTIDTTASPAAELLDQLDEIGKLMDDWDGYGAARVGEEAIVQARGVLPGLTILPDAVLPSVAGTLLMEWEAVFGTASLELGRDSFSFYTSPAMGDAILLGGGMREFNVEDINFAVATVVAGAVPKAVENRH